MTEIGFQSNFFEFCALVMMMLILKPQYDQNFVLSVYSRYLCWCINYEPLIELKHSTPRSVVHLAMFSVRILQANVNFNVVRYPARWPFPSTLGPLHWSSIFPTSREHRNIVHLCTTKEGTDWNHEISLFIEQHPF